MDAPSLTTPRGAVSDIEDWGTVSVTDRCCGAMTCRVLAPDVFLEAKQGTQEGDKNFTYVGKKITSDSELRQVRRAVAACPFQALRYKRGKKGAAVLLEDVNSAYPIPIDQQGSVYMLGFYSPGNAGATTYLIVRPKGGNVLIDCPKPESVLIERIKKEHGGVDWIVFTHKDHTAFHAQWKEAFPEVKRVLHGADIVEETGHFFYSNTAEMEVKLSGEKTQALDKDGDILIIPIPGHTAGSIAILYSNTYLFTGDSLHWSQARGHLVSSRLHCWGDWARQTASVAKLSEYEWLHVLPGHGESRAFNSKESAQEALQQGCQWMKQQPSGNTSFDRFFPWLKLRTYAGFQKLPTWLRVSAERLLAPVGAPGTLTRDKYYSFFKVLVAFWVLFRLLPRLKSRLARYLAKSRMEICHIAYGHPSLITGNGL